MPNQRSNVSIATERIFKETSDFIIIGLTGRTGSGCSTAASILSNKTPFIPKSSSIYESENDKRKYSIIREYAKENWEPFATIQVKSIITGSILDLNYQEFTKLLETTLSKNDISENLNNFKDQYTEAHKHKLEFNQLKEETNDEIATKKERGWELYFHYLPKFCDTLKIYLQNNIGPDSYTTLYQIAGDNIRASGTANIGSFYPEKIFTIPKIINQLIKVIRHKATGKSLIAIDAIRNPYEAIFFHQRYANFYLFAINTPNEERLRHLRSSHKFSEDQIKALDNKEYPSKLAGNGTFTSQNIQKCIEISDIHINNPSRKKHDDQDLASQLFWYISLIMHPGLITPTQIERGMHIAYSAKLNSGCISRQVGAVITDKNYSIKAVGWNNTPEGQTPCLLRSAKELLEGGVKNVYSSYERENDSFHSALKYSFTPEIIESKDLKGRNIPYCFKEIQNKIENEKNQVHTRSLHAEENAFLQITKYGGTGIEGGILFTTASPCELCSKKAYQLGIKKVIYIDPYPGISKEHILDSGTNPPELILFRGAIGRAYHKLYMPLIPYKDELRMLTGLEITTTIQKNK